MCKILRKWNWSLTFSIVAVAISLVATYNYYLNDKPVYSDSESFLVSVLAVLVTILIGWQVYSSIDFREDLKFVKEQRKQFINLIELQRETYLNTYDIYNYIVYSFIKLDITSEESELRTIILELNNTAKNGIKAKFDTTTDSNIKYISSLENEQLKAILNLTTKAMRKSDFVNKNLSDFKNEVKKKINNFTYNF